MAKIYACLLGDWICLNDEPTCTIGRNKQKPYQWWEENADIWAPFEREKENTLYQLNYLTISYKGHNYRINPIFIQIVD